MISSAVSPDRVSRVVGYDLKPGSLQLSSPNLPQRIALLGQANTDKQAGLSTQPQQITSEAQAGDLYGFGSMLHIMARILLPSIGGNLGAIPVIAYPQAAPGGGVAEQQTITVSNNAAKTVTIQVRINGRVFIDTDSLEVVVNSGDTPTVTAQAIADRINACVKCPVSAAAAVGVVTLTCKWTGAPSGDLSVEVVDENTSGQTFVIAETVAGAGTSIAEVNASLALFNDNWNTIVINPYGTALNATLEAFNGKPSSSGSATGRYNGIVFRPFFGLVGNNSKINTGNEITNLNANEVTMINCPAPGSKGWPFEAAANMARLVARQDQDTPHLDVNAQSYPDMPVPEDEDIGIYADYDERDTLVKGGASTVTLVGGKYVIQDLVTGYRPTGEQPPQYRYKRSLSQDFQIRYGYYLLEQVYVVDHAIAADDAPVEAEKVIKPKTWKGVVSNYATDLESRAIITDRAFMVADLEVEINATNPDRLDTSFRYKRSSYARIASTTGEANFSTGS